MANCVYINNKKIEVSNRIAIIHRLTNSKRLQPYSFYNTFAKDFIVDRQTFKFIYLEVNGSPFTHSEWKFDRYINLCSYSIDASIWLAEFLNIMSSSFRKHGYKDRQFDLAFDKGINYPIGLSEEYCSIKTLLSFYTDLVTDYATVSCNYLIPIKYINKLLEDRACPYREQDIRKDLNNHGLINKVSDTHYEWINKSFLIWLSKTSVLRLAEFNQYKLFKGLLLPSDIYYNHLDQYPPDLSIPIIETML